MNFRVKFQNQANKSVKLHDKYLEEKQLNSEKRKLEKFEKQKAKKIESVKAGEKVKLLEGFHFRWLRVVDNAYKCCWRILFRFAHLNHAIFWPSKIKLYKTYPKSIFYL